MIKDYGAEINITCEASKQVTSKLNRFFFFFLRRLAH